MTSIWVFNACLLIAITLVTGQLSDNEDELLNWCIDAKNHKTKPGPEDHLHQQCLPWKDRSCCTQNVSHTLHYSNMYNFDWDHCSQVKAMSNACRKHFVQDLCFYECEPNLGPWVVEVDMKMRKERAFGVPLCASDCDAWYNDCKDDYTCVDNWSRNFVWLGGKNTCPVTSTCQPYSVIFKGSAKVFCESVWDEAWRYTDDSQPCMRLWFNGSLGNPNDAVAKAKVAELYKVHNHKSHHGQPSAAVSLDSRHLHIYNVFIFVIISTLVTFN